MSTRFSMQDEINIAVHNLDAIAKFARTYPDAPFLTFGQLPMMAKASEIPSVVLDETRLDEVLTMFGRDGWKLYDLQPRMPSETYVRTDRWQAHKIVDGVKLVLTGLETEAAKFVRKNAEADVAR